MGHQFTKKKSRQSVHKKNWHNPRIHYYIVWLHNQENKKQENPIHPAGTEY